MKYSIVIPVFNSAVDLRELCDRLTRVFHKISSDYEIILVDDASSDNSWDIMRELHTEDPRIKIIQHGRNFGQHKALLCGLKHSQGDLVITMDDDLQHPPEEITKLVQTIKDKDEIDVVMGDYKVKQHAWFRNLGTNMMNSISSYIFSKDRNLRLNSFRIMRRSIVRELENTKCHNPRISLLLLLITNRIINVKVDHHPRKHGKSGYSFRRLVTDTLDNILSNSSLPLQLVTYLGFGSAILSAVLALFFLYRYLFVGILLSGWTSTILLLLFFSGILLFSFGVVGEYLIRILREVQATPRSVVRRKEL